MTRAELRTEPLSEAAALRVIVTQMGARHNYALPRMLYRRGVLERFYTDIHASGMVARMAHGWPRTLDFQLVGKLRRRTIEDIPRSLVYSDRMITLRSALAFPETNHERYRREDAAFGRRMIEWGTGTANVVYGVYGSGVPFWRHARAQGLKVAVDIFITPLYHRIVAQEREAFPDWEEPLADIRDERALTDLVTREHIEACDMLLCPSEGVADDVVTFARELLPGNRDLPAISVVPYGIKVRPPGPGVRELRPVPGRILFAGGADVRKGIHYLAEAAHLLKGSGRPYQFRIAGLAVERVRRHPRAAVLDFLGHLSRDRLEEELATADVLVLPTLAEGSATVVYEALAFGVPVITTRSAGSIVVDGREGLIVRERDAAGLARAIEHLVGDRARRDVMAHAARATADQFDEGPWGDRLVDALLPLALSGA